MAYKKASVLILFLLLTLTAFFGALSDYDSDNKKIHNLELVQNKLLQLTYIDEIITQLQKERGLSIIYYVDKSKKYALALDAQRKKINFFINKASKHIPIAKLSLKRQEAIEIINNSKISRFQAFMSYSNLIDTLLHQSELLILKTNNSDIKNSLIFYNDLNIMQESAAKLRGLIGAILTTKTISKQEYNTVIILNSLLKKYYQKVKGNIALELSFEKNSVKATLSTVNKIINIPNLNAKSLQAINIQPLQWFDIASTSVNIIRESIIQEIVI